MLGDNVKTLAYGHRDIPADAVIIEEDADVPDDVVVEAHIALDRPLPAPADAPPAPVVQVVPPVGPQKPACWLGREPPDDMIDRILFAVELVTVKDDLPDSTGELSDNDFADVWMHARERAARCENLRAFVDNLCVALISNDMVAYIDLTA